MDLNPAVDALRAGLVVGLPTDTVYGLAADASQPDAVGRLFVLKHRPAGVEIPILVADEQQAADVGELTPSARTLVVRFWPGALTVVVPRRSGEPPTVGLRCPDRPIVRELCRRVGPLATTSANPHGQPPLTTAEGVRSAFGDTIALVIDGGTCDGEPSTVVDCTGPAIALLRPGRIAWSDISRGERA